MKCLFFVFLFGIFVVIVYIFCKFWFFFDFFDLLQYCDGKFYNVLFCLVMGLWVGVEIWWMFLFNKFKGIVFVYLILVKLLDCVMLDVVLDCSLFWLGYFMILLKLCGQYWLIDLVFFEWVLLVQWMGLVCFYVLLISIDVLLLIVGVIFLYNYYDYLDYVVVMQLVGKIVCFIVLFGVGDQLIVWGVDVCKVEQLDWW